MTLFLLVYGASGVPAFGLRKVDINGDGMMEWDEFTRFVVVKAQLHHAQMSIDQLAEYRQGSRQARTYTCVKIGEMFFVNTDAEG